MLYAIKLTNDGGRKWWIEPITDWTKWQKDNITDLKPEFRPVFLECLPGYNDNIPNNAVLLLKGSVIMPKPVETVVDYVLPDNWQF